MTKQIFGRLIIGLITFGVFAMPSFAQIKNEPQTQSAIPPSLRTRSNETLVYNALRQILGAQATYNATIGGGNFTASLRELADLEYIDQILGNGEKYGYYFSVTAINGSPNNPAFFTVTATPRRYPRTGRRSFYIDNFGTIRGADKNGAVATVNDPVIIICGNNETEAIQSLRNLLGAEFTYQSILGTGNFGTLQELHSSGLIDSSTARGDRCGYHFVVVTTNGSPNNQARFFITAVPNQYGITGRRSFYIDEIGVIRGADRNGQPADADDPPIEF